MGLALLKKTVNSLEPEDGPLRRAAGGPLEDLNVGAAVGLDSTGPAKFVTPGRTGSDAD